MDWLREPLVAIWVPVKLCVDTSRAWRCQIPPAAQSSRRRFARRTKDLPRPKSRVRVSQSGIAHITDRPDRSPPDKLERAARTALRVAVRVAVAVAVVVRIRRIVAL